MGHRSGGGRHSLVRLYQVVTVTILLNKSVSKTDQSVNIEGKRNSSGVFYSKVSGMNKTTSLTEFCSPESSWKYQLLTASSTTLNEECMRVILCCITVYKSVSLWAWKGNDLVQILKLFLAQCIFGNFLIVFIVPGCLRLGKLWGLSPASCFEKMVIIVLFVCPFRRISVPPRTVLAGAVTDFGDALFNDGSVVTNLCHGLPTRLLSFHSLYQQTVLYRSQLRLEYLLELSSIMSLIMEFRDHFKSSFLRFFCLSF